MSGSWVLRPGIFARRIAASAAIFTTILLAPIVAVAAPYAAIVMDARTGQVLHEQNADTRLHPASLTKMLTLYIAFDAIRRGEISLNDMVTISRHAASQPPSRLGLRAGQQISVRHLIRAAAIKSANDAAAALGDHISGNERAFANRMNRTAKALGMHRSSFRNAHGLTADGHLSTARDMTLLGRRLFYDFPQHYPMFSRLTEDAGVARVNNTNRRFLEGYRGADGIKTGYTNAAGFNLTASAERGNKRLVATVFGGVSTAHRNQKMAQILDIGFGAAPNRTRTTPPPPVALANIAADDGQRDGAPGGAGKTIRLQTTRANSPRPPRRPGDAAPPAAMLAEVTSGVADVLAALNAPAEPAPEALPFAVAELERPPTRPETATGVEAPAATEALSEATDLLAGLLTQTPHLPPRPRPASLSVAPPQIAEAPAAEELPFQVVDADVADAGLSAAAAVADLLASVTGAPEAEPVAAPVEEPVAVAKAPEPEPTAPEASALAALTPPPQRPDVTLPASLTELAEADLPEDMPVPLADDSDAVPAPTREFAGRLVVPTLNGTRPRAQPGEIVMTVAARDTSDTPLPANVQRTSSGPAPAAEVVSRVSTSGGRHWAVTLGKFNNRGTAERALLQTALSETRALEGALRKVNQKAGGWEAVFAGLTRDQADLACRRLQARAINCFTLGP